MDWIAAIGTVLALAGLAVGVVSVPHNPLFGVAKLLFVCAALLFFVKAVWWGLTTTQGAWARFALVGLIGGLSSTGLMSALRWVAEGEQARKAELAGTAAARKYSAPIVRPAPTKLPLPRLIPKSHAPIKALKRDAPASSPPATAQASTEEQAARNDMLSRLTSTYIASHDGITPRMMGGLELPPIDWMNAELERLHANWRVLSTDGPTARTINIDPTAKTDANPQAH